MKRSVVAFLFLLASVSPGAGQTIVGEAVINFSLPDLNGSFRSPNQFRGKILGIFLIGHD
jgi:hypothetical protein